MSIVTSTFIVREVLSMQISMKCSIAVHCLIFINEASKETKVTSNLLSKSTGSNAVIIRNILSSLKKSGLINVARGTGGAELCKNASDITLYDIYISLEPDGILDLIKVHSCKENKCSIANHIREVLKKPYNQIEEAVIRTMKEITLESMINDYRKCTKKEMP